MDTRKKLLGVLKEKAVVFGARQLASGRVSNYYIDGRLVTLDPEGIYLVGKVILGMLAGAKIDAVGGLTMGADPIASAVSLLSHLEKTPVSAFIVRNGKKEHGMGKSVEGNLKPGWRVAIVDDVVTSGGSILKAAEAVEKAGAVVAKVIVIVDRQEGAGEALAKKGYTLEPIFTKTDLEVEN